jgi:hypothetical protein
MTGSKASASSGSVSLTGDNLGNIVNLNVAAGANVNLQLERKIAGELPSFLSNVIVLFAQETLSQYGTGGRRELPPEVVTKIAYNNLASNHPIIADYRRYSIVLENCYQGVEQQNDDVRYLVRRKAAFVYHNQLSSACQKASVAPATQSEFARSHAVSLIAAVIAELLEQYKASKAVMVEQETAHLAVSLVVFDAIIECDVLERPVDVIAA